MHYIVLPKGVRERKSSVDQAKAAFKKKREHDWELSMTRPRRKNKL